MWMKREVLAQLRLSEPNAHDPKSEAQRNPGVDWSVAPLSTCRDMSYAEFVGLPDVDLFSDPTVRLVESLRSQLDLRAWPRAELPRWLWTLWQPDARVFEDGLTTIYDGGWTETETLPIWDDDCPWCRYARAIGIDPLAYLDDLDATTADLRT
jgi:hypothetical protein